MINAQTEVTITGLIAGGIWQPGITAGKNFTVRSRDTTLQDLVIQATSDGDFRYVAIIDAMVSFTRTVKTATGIIKRTREMDIRQFPSVSEYVVKSESAEYYDGLESVQDYAYEE